MNKEKKKEEEVEAYMTPEQIKQMQIITDEIKRLKGQKLVKEQIEELNKQLDELKKAHKKQPTNKVVKVWVGGLRKLIKWWTMSDLTPKEREERRRKFESASNNLFGMSENREDNEMPEIFGGSGSNNQRNPLSFGGSDDSDDEMPSFFDEIAPMKRKKTGNVKSKTKRQGKQSKKHTTKQKGRQKYIIQNGKAYPIARDEPEETRYKPKKRKKASVTKKKEEEDDEEDGPGMFFDING